MASALAYNSCSLPSAGDLRPAYPAIQSACSGVTVVRATPAFHSAAWPDATVDKIAMRAAVAIGAIRSFINPIQTSLSVLSND